ncbi:MAG TPA: hypothetical protein VN688_05655 [Gemmataceae bacterium]|nr:hypothetical protein [Gemmataceae bacterium]
MTVERDALRDWHRLFGLLLTDFFTNSPFTVEVERDVSKQQQFLDVVILRRKPGHFAERLPDGMDNLAAHNLLTFKSHREALDSWAMKELVGHYVAYRKLVSPSPSELLSEDQFRLFAVCARFPHNLSGQVPWQERQAGVYDCRWGTDTVCVVVAGQLPQEPHNAPLHLFSASPTLVDFGQDTYRQRSEYTSGMLRQLLKNYVAEGFAMTYTVADFRRDSIRREFMELSPQERRDILQLIPPRERREALECLPLRERRDLFEALPPEDIRQLLQSLPPRDCQRLFHSLPPEERRQMLESLPPEERREMLESLPPEERLAGLSAEQIQQYLDQLTAGQPAQPRKPQRKR